MLLAAFVLIPLFGGVGGVVTWVVSAFKDTSAVGATLASNDGHVMKTSKALVPVPLAAAPVLKPEKLEGVDSITVSYFDPDVEMDVRVNTQVAAVLLYSNIHVKFETVSPTVKEVEIKDGATVTLADGTVANVCESNVPCSALMVDDAANADALLEEAIAALVAANVTNATWDDAERGRRQLEGAAHRLVRGRQDDARLGLSLRAGKYVDVRSHSRRRGVRGREWRPEHPFSCSLTQAAAKSSKYACWSFA